MGGVIIKSVLLQRGLGKTTALIKNSAKTGDLLVVVNRFMVGHAMEMAKKIGVEIKEPITHEEYFAFITGNGISSKVSRIMDETMRNNNGYIIDDLDLFLQDTIAPKAGARINLVSFTI